MWNICEEAGGLMDHTWRAVILGGREDCFIPEEKTELLGGNKFGWKNWEH
jgi:hypothetical protein